MKSLYFTVMLLCVMGMVGKGWAQAPTANQNPAPVATAINKENYIIFPAQFTNNIEYYGEVKEYPYVYYNGYFWYPKADATIVEGYTPTYWNGQYWYASRVHPHHVYVEKQNVVYLIPVDPKGILE